MELKQRKELLSAAVNAALKAGEEILKVYYSQDYEIDHKSDDSPLTKADRKAHEIIQEVLESYGIPVLSEEGEHLPYSERSKWDWCWIVDPLDGTKEFIKRNNEFTVNIALVNGQEPLCGVIYVPVYKQLYIGDIELGAYRVDDIVEFHSSLDNLINRGISLPLEGGERNYTVVGSRSHMNDETRRFIDELKSEHGEVQLISKGSSLKLCMVAEGVADVYPRFAPTMEWDVAAGHAIISAAGFQVVRVDGGQILEYNKMDLTNPWFIAR